eukprot:1671006-Alexandrium_andersonii.AAC.1
MHGSPCMKAVEAARSGVERFGTFSCRPQDVWSTFLQAPKCQHATILRVRAWDRDVFGSAGARP